MSKEEEKMLMIAIKNSLREREAHPVTKLHEIREMKTFRPTEEEFKDPIDYIENLYKSGAHKYG